MYKFLFFLFFIPFLALSKPIDKFSIDIDESTYVDNIHYDKELNMIVVNVHGKFLIFTVNDYFGIRVENNADIEKKLVELLGSDIKVKHLIKK